MNELEQIGPPFTVPAGTGPDAKDAIEEHLFGLGFGLENWNWTMPVKGAHYLVWQPESGHCTLNRATSHGDTADAVLLTRIP